MAFRADRFFKLALLFKKSAPPADYSPRLAFGSGFLARSERRLKFEAFPMDQIFTKSIGAKR
jgi:hypothetical protein